MAYRATVLPTMDGFEVSERPVESLWTNPAPLGTNLSHLRRGILATVLVGGRAPPWGVVVRKLRRGVWEAAIGDARAFLLRDRSRKGGEKLLPAEHPFELVAALGVVQAVDVRPCRITGHFLHPEVRVRDARDLG